MTVEKRPDGKWRAYVSIRNPDGTWLRVRKSAPTRARAIELEREIRAGIAAGHAVRVQSCTFAEWSTVFLDTYAVTNNKPSEVATKRTVFRRHLVPHFGALRLDDIDLAAVEAFKADRLQAGLAPKSINNALTMLRKALAVAHEWSRRRLPPPRMKWLHVPDSTFDFLTFEEAARLLAAAPAEWRTMITVALRCGLRQGELLALSWDSVDLVAGRLTVRANAWKGMIGDPKGKRTRHVPLSDGAVAALREQKARTYLAGAYVFGGAKMLTKGECKRPLWGACRRAGLRRIGWHVLRHTFASHLAMRGVPVLTIKELLGHRSLEMTMRYAHLAPDMGRAAVQVLDGRSDLVLGTGATATSV